MYFLQDTRSNTIPDHFKFGHFQDGRKKGQHFYRESTCKIDLISVSGHQKHNKLGIKSKLNNCLFVTFVLVDREKTFRTHSLNYAVNLRDMLAVEQMPPDKYPGVYY